MRDAYEAEAVRLNEAERVARASRIATGMGFLRLVWVVALGILLSQAIIGVLTAIVHFVNAHVIPQ